MNTVTKFSTFIAIVAVIAMFFAAPIVSAVSPILAVILWTVGSFYGLGVVAQIITSYML